MKLINWIGQALSENGAPSSKRLFAFMFVLTACYVIIYKVHHSHELPPYVYYPLLGTICLLAGVATMAQLLQLRQGGRDDKPTKMDGDA